MQIKKFLETGISVDYISIVGIGILLSIPSIKLLYSTPLINIGVLGILAFALLLQKTIRYDPERKIYYFIWSCFSLLLLGGFYYGGFLTGFSALVNYLYLVIVVYLVIALSNREVLFGVGKFVFFWGLFLALWQLTLGVPTSRALGQHYLTVSLPIGVAFSYALSISAFADIKNTYRLGYAFSSLILFLALATLLSRSAILFPVAIFFLIFTLILFYSKSMNLQVKVKWVGGLFTALASLVFLFVSFFAQTFELRQLYRIMNMVQNIEGESRVERYGQAFNYFTEQPLFGFGTNSSNFLFGSYPHNIFLEILTHGGIVLFVVFLLLLCIYGFTIVKAIRNYSRSASILGFLAASLFYFLQWNTSFNITSAYIPIGAITLFTVGSLDLHKRSMNANIYIRSNTDTQSPGKPSKST